MPNTPVELLLWPCTPNPPSVCPDTPLPPVLKPATPVELLLVPITPKLLLLVASTVPLTLTSVPDWEIMESPNLVVPVQSGTVFTSPLPVSDCAWRDAAAERANKVERTNANGIFMEGLPF